MSRVAFPAFTNCLAAPAILFGDRHLAQHKKQAISLKTHDQLPKGSAEWRKPPDPPPLLAGLACLRPCHSLKTSLTNSQGNSSSRSPRRSADPCPFDPKPCVLHETSVNLQKNLASRLDETTGRCLPLERNECFFLEFTDVWCVLHTF